MRRIRRFGQALFLPIRGAKEWSLFLFVRNAGQGYVFP
jgi:hypothetical protein